jgi:hypothetical protein
MKTRRKTWVACWGCHGEGCTRCRGTGGTFKRRTLLRCVGGPLDGEDRFIADAPGYIQFNNSAGSGWRSPERQALLIWERLVR